MIAKRANKKSAYAVYEKVLTRFSQVGAAKRKLFGLSAKNADLAYLRERPAPFSKMWITNFPYHAHSRNFIKLKKKALFIAFQG